MEERIKRLIDIFIRGGFIVLCFILTYLFNALSQFSYGNSISLTNDSRVEILTENGAEASYTVEDGRIAVNVTKSGAAWDDITVLLTVDNADFDTAYIENALGEKADEHREYLDSLAAGPWVGSMHYMMTGDTVLIDTDLGYTFVDSALEEYSEGILSSAANDMRVSDDAVFEKGEGAVAMFMMGSALCGPLPEGTYYIKADLALTGVDSEEGGALPTDISTGLLKTILVDALTNTPFTSFFQVSSLLTFYGMMVLFCAIFFGYVDLRSAIRIGIRAGEGTGEWVLITTKTYIDGVCVDESSHWDDGSSILRGIIAFVISYALFLLTVPIRLVIIIIKDIVHLFIGDEYYDCYSLLGNVLGSIGVYALIAGVVGFMASWPILVPIICLPVAAGLILLAGKLCNDAEENY